jgi:hypothetical protein
MEERGYDHQVGFGRAVAVAMLLVLLKLVL